MPARAPANRFDTQVTGPARRALLMLLVLGAAGTMSATALAQQTFRIDRFAPPPTEQDGQAIQTPSTLGAWVPSFGLVIDYAHAPLRARTRNEEAAIVETRMVGHFLAALGISDRFELQLRVPVALGFGQALSAGRFEVRSPELFSMGDIALGGSAAIVGSGDRRGIWLGMGGQVLIPAGVENGWASDLEVGANGQVMLTYGSPVMTLLSSVGASYRAERAFENARAGSELNFGLGLMVPTLRWLDLAVELVGSSIFRIGGVGPRFFEGRGTPLELYLAGRARTDLGLSVDAGVSFGLTSAVGTPTIRLVLGVRYAMLNPEAGPGGNGTTPDPEHDACADESGARGDGMRNADRCPEIDSDSDGIPDESDECPRQAEDRDGVQDDDGCSDPDDDADGVLDARDNCPRAPGPHWTRGCPQTFRMNGDEVELLAPLEFQPRDAAILPSASILLDELRSMLAINPTWRVRLRVRGEGRGSRGTALGRQRAEEVASWLSEHGINSARFELGALDLDDPRPVRIELQRDPSGPEESSTIRDDASERSASPL